ncbi:MAG: hypothetical protein ACRC7S_10225 [Cetobacterium sp.]
MNEKDFNEQEYLKACLIRDMLNAKGMVATYVNITEVMKKEKEKLQQEVEDWKCKCGKLEEELDKKSETVVNLAKEKVKWAKKVRCVYEVDFENFVEKGEIYDVVEEDEESYRVSFKDNTTLWLHKKRFEIVE